MRPCHDVLEVRSLRVLSCKQQKLGTNWLNFTEKEFTGNNSSSQDGSGGVGWGEIGQPDSEHENNCPLQWSIRISTYICAQFKIRPTCLTLPNLFHSLRLELREKRYRLDPKWWKINNADADINGKDFGSSESKGVIRSWN